MSKSLMLADDNDHARSLVRRLLGRRRDWEICAEAIDSGEAVRKAKAARPDVAILDIAMQRLSGVEAARQIIANRREILVVAVSVYDPRPILSRLVQAGVRGFVPKARMGSQLIPAIEALLEGKTYFGLQRS